tara:strand:+ start:75 stop:563 length:489 start_codon:yes stop_codon:yes gene_type:complete
MTLREQMKLAEYVDLIFATLLVKFSWLMELAKLARNIQSLIPIYEFALLMNVTLQSRSSSLMELVRSAQTILAQTLYLEHVSAIFARMFKSNQFSGYALIALSISNQIPTVSNVSKISAYLQIMKYNLLMGHAHSALITHTQAHKSDNVTLTLATTRSKSRK